MEVVRDICSLKDNTKKIMLDNLQFTSEKVDTTPPIIMIDHKDEILTEIFQKFLKNIEENNLFHSKGLLLLSNQKGIVLRQYSLQGIPGFLSLDETKALDFSINLIGMNAIGLSAMFQEAFFVDKDEHHLNLLKEYSSVSLPIFDKNNKMIAIIGYLTAKELEKVEFDSLNTLAVAFKLGYSEFKRMSKLEKENQKNEALLTISQKLYTTFDVNEVLLEAVKNINFFYPDDELEILMTHDYFIPNAPIKKLSFIPNKNDISGKAFIEGKVIVNRRGETGNKGDIAIPLKGKQGIYGVIHISCNNKQVMSQEKINFLTNIANIISNAFENAKLYQQSNNLVKELKIINQITKRLNESLDKDSILEYVINESINIFDAHNVCIFKTNNESQTLSVLSSNLQEIIDNTIHIDYGYMGLVTKSHEPIIIADIDSDQDNEDDYITSLGCRSLIASPILVNEELIGILTVSSNKPHHFSYENFRMLQLFSQHLGLALTNAYLHEKIQQLVIKDYLTDLYNRSYLDQKVEELMMKDQSGSILLFDIDNFKNINDTYGHQVGDQVLLQIANILKSSIREGDIAARWGGEELTLYLPNINTEIATKIAERISRKIENETNPQVTVSCGVATWTEQKNDIDYLKLIRIADQALYSAKRQGKNQVKVSIV